MTTLIGDCICSIPIARSSSKKLRNELFDLLFEAGKKSPICI
jgi:hypothetical protein